MPGTSPSASASSWLDPVALETALARESAPETAVVREILDKSLALEPLGPDEIVALLRVRKPEDMKLIFGTADLVKQKVYGDRIVLTAPLHISNTCASECRYCASRKGNTAIQRKRLDQAELREAARKLIRQGHKRVVLVSGQSTSADVEYWAEAVDALHRLFDGMGEIRRVNLDLGVLTAEEYALLRRTEAGTVNIYQETYHEASYHNAHPGGPKSDFAGRLLGPETALRAGMTDVGLGLALGLGPWEFDLLALAAHAAHLAREYGAGGRTVNLHRVRPAPGCDFQPPYAMNDEDFLRCVAITRLAIPYTGILLTTREPAGLWRAACNTGCSQLLTGSIANPYESWTDAPGEKAPFPIGEDCHLDEVVRFLLEEARHLPSFCTACPRLGRSGKEFISLVRGGNIKSQCGPNSMASFMEFLINYATPYTRQLGEKVIAEKLEQLAEHERGAAERLLQKVRSGRMDEFI